jgi:hypothetical protein
MEIFINLWNNWSNAEKIYIFSLISSVLIIVPFLVRMFTKNNTLTLFSAVSLLSSSLLTLLTIWFLNIIFSITITYIFLLTPIIVLFVNILNIGTCIGYYKVNSKKKNFSFNMLKKEYIRDSVQLSIFILLLFSSLSVFLTSSFLIFTLLSGFISISILWINYALLYKLVK